VQVPSVGPVAAHNLLEYDHPTLSTNCVVVDEPGVPPAPPPCHPLTESGGNKRAFWESNATLGDGAFLFISVRAIRLTSCFVHTDGEPTKKTLERIAKRRRTPGMIQPFPMPRECPYAVVVECGGAWGEFRVLEGLVHCMCAGCEFGIAYGLQPTNVFGLQVSFFLFPYGNMGNCTDVVFFNSQSFEFHGGKGSAGKWKASIRAHPDGFPEEYYHTFVNAGGIGGDETALGMSAVMGGRKPGRPPRDTSEGLGPWLERTCPEHPCLARSRNKEN
jgi:hypothetical protein